MRTGNWEPFGHNGWRHKARLTMRVFIRRNANKERPEKFQVFHYHPGRDGGVILQKPDYAFTMRKALKKAAVHMRHWNDPRKWREYW